MPTITAEELPQHGGRLLDDAKPGASNVVTEQGEPVMLTLPLGQAGGSSAERLALAVVLYEHGILSLGLTANVAGLTYSETIDALGHDDIAVLRLEPGELERELAAFGSQGRRQ